MYNIYVLMKDVQCICSILCTPACCLSLGEHEFTRVGNITWTSDFQEFGMTTEISQAYFRLLDVTGFWNMLSLEDMDELIKVAGQYTGLYTGRSE